MFQRICQRDYRGERRCTYGSSGHSRGTHSPNSKFFIDLSREQISQSNRQCKEAQLFALITSQDYSRRLNGLYEIYIKIRDIQVKEKKDHQNGWKSRRALAEQIRDIYVEICGGIDSIIQNIST